jgi:phosphoglycolate phosphatase
MHADVPMLRRAPFPARLVLFDLDGTLVDSVPDLAVAANRVLRELGRSEWSEAHYRRWVGNGVPRFVKRALTGEMLAEPPAELFERAFELFRRHYRDHVSALSRLYPAARELLEQLKTAGVRLVCVTNKSGLFARPLLVDLGIADYFDLLVAGDTVARLKPDPLPLLHACTELGVPPTQSVFVGDSANDVQAARAASMPVICVSYGYNHGRDVRELAPDAVVDSLAEVPQYLRLQTI